MVVVMWLSSRLGAVVSSLSGAVSAVEGGRGRLVGGTQIHTHTSCSPGECKGYCNMAAAAKLQQDCICNCVL
jgi:hypothetical protein